MSEILEREGASDLRDYLLGLTLHGVKLGLQNIRYLLDAAGNPQDQYPIVHVGGTNGKGSVLAMLMAMFQAAGYKTGRFTSPHLIDLSERFQVDGRSIPEAELQENIQFFRDIAEGMEPQPTFFEMNTAIAFRWLAQRKVEVGLIEVGMGGRLDSTNVASPIATAITNIDYDHMEFLGDTLEAIAFEKAGILKPGVPTVLGETRPGPREVLLDKAREMGCKVMRSGASFSHELDGDLWHPTLHYRSDTLEFRNAPLALAGRYQGENAAIAVALAGLCHAHFPLMNPKAIRDGLARASWPGRMERVLESPPVIIDVAHNLAGALHLSGAVTSAVVILAVSGDKDATGMVNALAPCADPLILTEFTGKRAMPLNELCAAARHHPHQTAPNLTDAIAHGISLASADRPLLITGSIYMAGEARRILIEHYGASPLRF